MNMWPLVNKRMRIKLIAAQTLRFWKIGNKYGQAILKNVNAPNIVVVTAIQRTQLTGRTT